MHINKEVLKSLKPCADRYENYLRHHANFDGSFGEFLDLPNISYSDKVWIAEKVLTKNKRVKWAILCAESVVHVFEKEYPDERCISNCIRYLKTVKDFNSLTDTEREEIERHLDIIQKALPAYAAFAAHYAVCAAAYAAHSAIYATSAVSYAIYATSAVSYATLAAFHATADAGEDADGARNNQRELNIQFLRMACSL